MDFLITGATGFIGRKLVTHLLGRGDTVNYLARRRSEDVDTRAAFHRWDGNSLPSLKDVPHIDAVIHLLGEPVAQRWTPEVKERIRRSRIQSTRHLVASMAQLSQKPKVFVSSSAVGYYGDRGNEILTEASMPGTGFLADVCVNWEYEALRARELGIHVATVRTATVLGREGGALPKMLTPFRLGIGGRFGSGKQWMSWIHVDDLLRLFLFCVDAEVSGAVNAGAPEPVTNAEFTRTLARTVHRPAIFPIPRFVLNTVLGEMSSFLFDSMRAIPKAAQDAGFRFDHPELAEALTHLVAQR